MATGTVTYLSSFAAQVEHAYAAAAAVAAERTALELAFDQARGDWAAEMRVVQAAKDFDAVHPSKDPLFEELHAAQLFGAQLPKVA